MPPWVLGTVIAAPLTLCVAGASFGYFVGLPWARTTVSDTMADTVATAVSRSIEESALPPGLLALTANDLGVNNAPATDECGVNLGFGASETEIYGFVTEISPAGILLVCAEFTYSAVPVVEDGRVELTEIEVSDDGLTLLLSRGAFERGMEDGINRALQAHGLKPTAVTLHHGVMRIIAKPTSPVVHADASAQRS